MPEMHLGAAEGCTMPEPLNLDVAKKHVAATAAAAVSPRAGPLACAGPLPCLPASSADIVHREAAAGGAHASSWVAPLAPTLCSTGVSGGGGRQQHEAASPTPATQGRTRSAKPLPPTPPSQGHTRTSKPLPSSPPSLDSPWARFCCRASAATPAPLPPPAPTLTAPAAPASLLAALGGCSGAVGIVPALPPRAPSFTTPRHRAQASVEAGSPLDSTPVVLLPSPSLATRDKNATAPATSTPVSVGGMLGALLYVCACLCVPV